MSPTRGLKKITNACFSTPQEDKDLLNIGNVSIMANDTDVARDLVLGVGIFSGFEPGLFVETGVSNFNELNASAYTSANSHSGLELI